MHPRALEPVNPIDHHTLAQASFQRIRKPDRRQQWLLTRGITWCIECSAPMVKVVHRFQAQASPDAPSAESHSNSEVESGESSPESGNKAAVPQQSSLEQSMAQDNPLEVGAVEPVSKAGAQALVSDVFVAHIPIVAMEIIPVPQTPGQIAQSGKASRSGQESG